MKQKNIYLSIVLLFYSNFIVAEIQTSGPEYFDVNYNSETIKIDNKDFELFLTNIFATARIIDKEETLSHGLRACYKTLMDGKKEYSIKDMQEALPELLELANAYDEILKAPRPGNIPHNAIVGPGGCDLSNVIQLLLKISNDLGICCSILQQDFQITWSILAHIESLLTASAIDLSPIFTALNAGFNGTFSALDECCTTINNEFQQTWTILATISSSLCNALPITTPTIIASPGYYCLANDIFNTLTITTDNVTVDLNNHTISAPGTIGINVSGATNAIIKNGKINTVSTGIECNTTNTCQIFDMLITNCANNGIQLDSGSSDNSINNSILDTISNIGIFGVALNNDIQCNAITVRNTITPISMTSSKNCNFINCSILDCGSTISTNAFSVTGSNNQLTNCSIINFQGNIGFFVDADNSILENCTVQNIFNTVPFANCTGILSLRSNTKCIDCSVINLNATSAATGYLLVGDGNSTLQNCLMQLCSSAAGAASATAFSVTSDSVNLINCQAYLSDGVGFRINGGTATLQNCTAAHNGTDGFSFTSLPVFVGNCVAFLNGGNGFNNVPGGTIQMYSCFASQNTAANYVNPTNVVAAATAGAFENAFI